MLINRPIQKSVGKLIGLVGTQKAYSIIRSASKSSPSLSPSNQTPRLRTLQVQTCNSPAKKPFSSRAPTEPPLTGLGADVTGSVTYPGFPILPMATYTGDCLGNPGPGGKRIAVDSEGLVLASDGGFWISDEYGLYIYHFSASGRMTQAIQPPDAYLPYSNGNLLQRQLPTHLRPEQRHQPHRHSNRPRQQPRRGRTDRLRRLENSLRAPPIRARPRR